MSAVFVYVTCPDADEASKIGRAAVEEKLAACANILPGMTSIHRWQGEIETAGETVLILKTRADLFEVLAARVKALHSHETPCIAALPLAAAEKGYLAWIFDSTDNGLRHV